jgi:hypothetical protein
MFTSIALATLIAQMPAATPPEAKQFDFWIGTWEAESVTTGPDGKQTIQKGTNTIRKIMDGKVIHESFVMGSFKGESWSVYNPKAKRWQQTWVDNSAGYIPLTGTWDDSGKQMVLHTLTNPNHPDALNRMTFKNITKNGFDWDWEASQDGGKTYQMSWHLKYTRKK